MKHALCGVPAWALLFLVGCSSSPEAPLEVASSPVAVAVAPSPPPDPNPLRLKGEVVDCPAMSVAPLGSTWYAINDHERWAENQLCYRGTSTSSLELLHDNPDGETCAVRWTGVVTTDYKHGFAAMGVDLQTNLEPYKQLVLAVRGDGRKYRTQFPMSDQLQRALEGGCDNRDFDFYGSVFTCGDGTDRWQEVRIDLRRLKQEGWGNRWKFHLGKVNRFQVQTVGRPIDHFQCDVEVKRLVEEK